MRRKRKKERVSKSDCLMLARQWKNPDSRGYFTSMLLEEHGGLRLSHLGFDRARIKRAQTEPKPQKEPRELLLEPVMLHVREVAEGKHGPGVISPGVRALAERNFPHYELFLLETYGAPLAIVAALARLGGLDGARVGVPGINRRESVFCLDGTELDMIRGNFERDPELEFGRLYWKYCMPLLREAREAAFI